jgi:GDP-L-fucose synthase
LDKEVTTDLINIGSNEEVSIKDLAYMIKDLLGYEGNIIFDDTKPDGNPRKLLDSSLINELGWKSTVNLNEGLKLTYDWFNKNFDSLRK